MDNKQCYFCKAKATRTAYWGNIGNRYEVLSCYECVDKAAESDRKWARLVGGFAEYNQYCDARGR